LLSLFGRGKKKKKKRKSRIHLFSCLVPGGRKKIKEGGQSAFVISCLLFQQKGKQKKVEFLFLAVSTQKGGGKGAPVPREGG